MAWWPGNNWTIEADLPTGNNVHFKYVVVELEEGPWYVKRWEESPPRSIALSQSTQLIDFPWNF